MSQREPPPPERTTAMVTGTALIWTAPLNGCGTWEPFIIARNCVRGKEIRAGQARLNSCFYLRRLARALLPGVRCWRL
jgi:hypothetical protein